MVRALVVASPRRFTLVRLHERIRDTFWIIPALFLIGAGALAFGVKELDRHLEDDAGQSLWWVGTAEGASSVLQVIATSTLTFLGVVFSITLVALQLASQQFSPRVTRTFARSTTTKVALGIFISTFIFALVTLAAQEASAQTGTAPVAAVSVAMLLVGASVAAFIVFASSTIRLIRIPHTSSAPSPGRRGRRSMRTGRPRTPTSRSRTGAGASRPTSSGSARPRCRSRARATGSSSASM